MRISEICVRAAVGCVLAGSFLTAGGAAARADDMVVISPGTQELPPTELWEDHMREVLRRLYGELGGNPYELDGKPLKTATTMVHAQYYLYGIPLGLTADQVTQIENDGLELATCADWGSGPPVGTDYKLIVTMHDLGLAIYRSAVLY